MNLLTQLLTASAGLSGSSGGPVNPLTTPARYALTPNLNGLAVMAGLQNNTAIPVLSTVNTSETGLVQVAIDQTRDVAFAISYDQNTLVALDISDKSNISVISSYSSTVYFNGPIDIKLDTTNQIAYVVNFIGDSISAIDISNTSGMTGIGRFTDSTNMDAPTSLVLDLENQFAFVVGSFSYSVRAVNIADPVNLVGIYTISGAINGLDSLPNDIAIDTDTSTLFVTKPSGQGIVKFTYNFAASISYSDDITNPSLSNPRAIALDPTTSYGYVTNTTGDSIVSFTMSSLSVANVLVSSSYLNDAWELAIDYSRQFVFVTSNNSNYFASVDISNPTNMSIQAFALDSSYNSNRGIALYYESF